MRLDIFSSHGTCYFYETRDVIIKFRFKFILQPLNYWLGLQHLATEYLAFQPSNIKTIQFSTLGQFSTLFLNSHNSILISLVKKYYMALNNSKIKIDA
jgi:hypothetical protein